jgi:single-strand DNA-binding protein
MFNRIILMGRLTKDPELKNTQSGIPMCRFSIAVDRAYSKGQEKQTDFIDITAWRQTAEFVAKYFSKGRVILVEGKLQNNNYTDQNGVKHYQNVVIADSVAFCGDKSGGQQNGQQAPPAQQPYQNQYQQGYAQNQGYQQPYQQGYNQPQQGYAQPQQNYQQPAQNQGYRQAPPPQNYAPAQNQPPQGYQQNNQPPPAVGDFSDFETILDDGEVPF